MRPGSGECDVFLSSRCPLGALPYPWLLPWPKDGPPGWSTRPSAPCHLTEEPGSLGGRFPRGPPPTGPSQSPLCWPGPGPGDRPPGIAGCPGEAAGVLSQLTAVSFGDAAGESPQVESRGPCPTQRSGLPAPAQRPFAHTERGCPLGLFPHPREPLPLGLKPGACRRCTGPAGLPLMRPRPWPTAGDHDSPAFIAETAERGAAWPRDPPRPPASSPVLGREAAEYVYFEEVKG